MTLLSISVIFQNIVQGVRPGCQDHVGTKNLLSGSFPSTFLPGSVTDSAISDSVESLSQGRVPAHCPHTNKNQKRSGHKTNSMWPRKEGERHYAELSLPHPSGLIDQITNHLRLPALHFVKLSIFTQSQWDKNCLWVWKHPRSL